MAIAFKLNNQSVKHQQDQQDRSQSKSNVELAEVSVLISPETIKLLKRGTHREIWTPNNHTTKHAMRQGFRTGRQT